MYSNGQYKFGGGWDADDFVFVTIETGGLCTLKKVQAIHLVAEGICVISIVLVCAVLASMAAGVLMAYGICYGMFALFRIHARQVAVELAGDVTSAPRTAEG